MKTADRLIKIAKQLESLESSEARRESQRFIVRRLSPPSDLLGCVLIAENVSAAELKTMLTLYEEVPFLLDEIEQRDRSRSVEAGLRQEQFDKAIAQRDEAESKLKDVAGVIEAARYAKAFLSSGRYSDEEFVAYGCPSASSIFDRLVDTLASYDAHIR